jgi:hypothetical protein
LEKDGDSGIFKNKVETDRKYCSREGILINWKKRWLETDGDSGKFKNIVEPDGK